MVSNMRIRHNAVFMLLFIPAIYKFFTGKKFDPIEGNVVDSKLMTRKRGSVENVPLVKVIY